jgi:hypothetical protein
MSQVFSAALTVATDQTFMGRLMMTGLRARLGPTTPGLGPMES